MPTALSRTVAVSVAAALTAVLAPAATARAESAVSVDSAGVTISGKGYGHGWGMSQWGAYGAATKGLSWQKILGFYYPGTTLTKTKTSHVRVWLSEDDADLKVLPSTGLRVYNVGTTASYTLPTGTGYKQWRMRRSGSVNQLQYKNAAGTWVTKAAPGLNAAKAWRFDNSANLLKVVMPSGSTRSYRGQAGLVFTTSSAKVVNRLPLDQYVQGVVPSEMPTSWHLEAVKAQSVAARTYALRVAQSGYTGYDVCDTIACQVYRGSGNETARGNSATAATAGTVVSYKGALALTQFSASNGGARAKGSQPYLAAGADPYDTALTSQKWTKTVSRSSLGKAFSGVGTVTKVQVLARDGSGSYGGRATRIKITGSGGSKTVDGATFRRALGLRSELLTVSEG